MNLFWPYIFFRHPLCRGISCGPRLIQFGGLSAENDLQTHRFMMKKIFRAKMAIFGHEIFSRAMSQEYPGALGGHPGGLPGPSPSYLIRRCGILDTRKHISAQDEHLYKDMMPCKVFH